MRNLMEEQNAGLQMCTIIKDIYNEKMRMPQRFFVIRWTRSVTVLDRSLKIIQMFTG